uniref:Uncharacterized protein n=1 Tax=Trichobilharzia regenti TaxID=157069 RepID=A0AA85KEF3_TRIRE|nr:unnamed protein product [Trichobilharzia regenti]
MYRILSLIFYLIVNIRFLLSLDISKPQDNSELRKPIIIKAPDDVITTESVLEFTCKAQGNPTPLIIWYNASTGEPLIDRFQTSGHQTSIHMNKHQGNLMISNPAPRKSYFVYCNATNSVGWVTSWPPVLGAIAYLDSEFPLNPTDIEADQGASVTFDCTPPQGFPKPMIFWIKDNQTIIEANKSQSSHLSNIRIMLDGKLRIHPVSIKDTGNYVCAASNLIGKRLSRSARLQVKSHDYIKRGAKHIRARQGEQVKLVCPSIITDKPIKWRRKSKDSVIASDRIEQRKTYLIISHARYTDSDVYICTAQNGDEVEIRLTVETPPIFLKSPSDLNLNVGEKAVFLCSVDGIPKPSIYWELPDKSPIFPSDNLLEKQTSNKYRVYNNGTLEINSITLQDAGKYHCIAHSSVDMVQTSAVLRVKQAKSDETSSSASKAVRYVPPYIGLPPSNKTQVVGKSVLIDCEIPRFVKIVYSHKLKDDKHLGQDNADTFSLQSTEHWEVSWKRSSLSNANMNQLTNGVIHRNSSRFKILQSGSLQINDLQINDSGVYTCLVKDDTHAINEATIHLTVLFSKPKEGISDYLQEYPLSAPNNLQVMNTTEQSVTLTWNPPFLYATGSHSRSILPMNYWIELYTPDRPNDGWIVIERSWPVNLITLNGLSVNIPYYIIIRAKLGQGRVGWASDPFGPIYTETLNNYAENSSKSDNLTVDEFILKPVELKNVQLTVLSSKSIHVSWNVYEEASVLSRISGYIIYYRSVEHVRCLNDKYSQISLSDKNFINNYCSLNPENYHKSASVSEVYKRLELMRQICQEEQESNTTDSVTSLPGVISTVTIDANYVKSELDKHSQRINHKITSLLTELRPFRCYEVGIRAFSGKISVNYLETSDIFTHTALTYETSPASPPRNIFAGWLFSESLEVGWTAPRVSDWNGIILGYIVYIHDEVLKTYHSVNVTSGSRKVAISLNSLPKSFSIQIAAYTCMGIGIRSDLLKIDTIQGINLQKNRELSTGRTTEDLKKPSVSFLTEYSVKDEQLISQPWFISAVVSSLLAWCIIFGICVVCWIRRNKFCKKRLTYQISQSNFQHDSPSKNKDCKSKVNSMNEITKGSAVQHNGYLNNQMGNGSLTISVSSGDQTLDMKMQPHVSYLPIRQSSENISNGSSLNGCGLQCFQYSNEPRINPSKSQLKSGRFPTNHNIASNPANNNSNIPQGYHTFTRRLNPHTQTNSGFFINDTQDLVQTNSSHVTSASQTSSEPFDSAIYLEQLPNRQHFNESPGPLLTPPTSMTAVNGDYCNEQGYTPVVTPYATASIIPNHNRDAIINSSRRQVQLNDNIQQNDTISSSDLYSQNMYITCVDLPNCQRQQMLHALTVLDSKT